MDKEYKNTDIKSVKKVEHIYDAAVRFCLHSKKFSREILCKAFELDLNECEILVRMMSDNGVIGSASDDGEFIVNDKYNHSDYLLKEELKEDKEKLKSNKPIIKIGKYLGLLSFVIFAISVYFLFRSPMSLLIAIPLSLLIAASAEKIGAIYSSIGVIAVCVLTLMWVNSVSPIFGERYENQLSIEKYKDIERKEKIEEMNKVSLGESKLKDSLKDPSSAEIRNSRLGLSGATCGEVNAKNSFGAFTGYKKFIQIGSITLMEDGSSEFTKEWNNICK